MGKSNLQPLLEKALSKDPGEQFEEDFQYILVFPNCFSTDPLESKYLDKELPLSECKKIFLGTFKMIEKQETKQRSISVLDLDKEGIGKLVQQRENWIKEAWTVFTRRHPNKTTPYRDFLEFVIETFLKVIQEHLQLEVRLFLSRDQDEIFCKLRASEKNLKIQADLIDYLCQLQRMPQEPKTYYSEVTPFGPFETNKTIESPNQLLSQYIYNEVEKYFKKYNSEGKKVKDPNEPGSFFRYKDKIRLLMSMLNSAVDMGVLVENNIITNEYPVHEPKQLQTLAQSWGSWFRFWKLGDNKALRNYFGEKIAMYFAWLEFLIYWLFFPAVIGLAAFILEKHFDDLQDTSDRMSISEIAILVFSLLLSISSTVHDQLWLRRQSELSWKWGVHKLSEVEQQRPAYKGEYGKDPITGQRKKISKRVRCEQFKRFIGTIVSILFVAAVLVMVGGIFYYKSGLDPNGWGNRMCALLNAFQIKIMNFIYQKVAVALNNWENYEFDSQYTDALVWKLYLFQFINSYISLFYIAFFKNFLETCENNDCMDELSIQLSTIIVTNFCLNFVELGLPWLSQKYQNWKEAKKLELSQNTELRETMSFTEAQSKFYPYETPLDDYMEIVITYGYIVMFSAAFPLLPLLALIMGVIEFRVDAFKLCNLTKRPVPYPANSIGKWQGITNSISVIGALTNTAIFIFTTDIFDFASTSEKWIMFMVIEHGLLLFKFLIDKNIPDVPRKVRRGLAWGERIANERLYGKSSEVDERKEKRNLYFEQNQVEPIIFSQDKIPTQNY